MTTPPSWRTKALDEAERFFQQSATWQQLGQGTYGVWLQEALRSKGAVTEDGPEEDSHIDCQHQIDKMEQEVTNKRSILQPQSSSAKKATLTSLKDVHENDPALLAECLEEIGYNTGIRQAQSILEEVSQGLWLQQVVLTKLSRAQFDRRVADQEATTTHITTDDAIIARFARLEYGDNLDLFKDMRTAVEHVDKVWYSETEPRHITAWLRWDPENLIYPAQTKFPRPRTAQDMLVLAHTDVSQITYAGLHNTIRQLTSASHKQILIAACCIEMALTKLCRTKETNQELVFICYRCTELLVRVTSKNNKSETTRTRAVFTRVNMLMKVKNLLNTAMYKFIETLFTPSFVQSPAQYIQSISITEEKQFPNGSGVLISDGDSVLKISLPVAQSMVQRCNKSEVCITMDRLLAMWVSVAAFGMKFEMPMEGPAQNWYLAHLADACTVMTTSIIKNLRL